MKRHTRIVTGIICAAVLLFCGFGFLATFEPLERSVQLLWRVIYIVAALAAIATLVFVNRRRPGA